jgi:hypothetical protein
MTVLGTLRLCALGALVAGLAAPSLAAAPDAPAGEQAQAPGGQRADASRSRRVELPFLLDFRAPDREPPRPARRASDDPHPYRDIPLKRA